MWAMGEVVCESHIFEKAYPQERPRFNKRTGAIYTPHTKHSPIREHFKDYCKEPLDLQFFLIAHFFFKEHKHFVTCDTDNLVKALADTLQIMNVISNDNLMVGHLGTKNLCEEDFVWMQIRLATPQSISYEDISKMPQIA